MKRQVTSLLLTLPSPFTSFTGEYGASGSLRSLNSVVISLLFMLPSPFTSPTFTGGSVVSSGSGVSSGFVSGSRGGVVVASELSSPLCVSVVSAGVVTVKPYVRLDVTVPFSEAERVRYELSHRDLPEYQTEYLDAVTFRLNVPEEQTDALITRLTELTAAKAKIKTIGIHMAY